jgi:hypothetical protein
LAPTRILVRRIEIGNPDQLNQRRNVEMKLVGKFAKSQPAA